MLVAVGGVLAIAQPGDLGGDETAAPSETTTTTTVDSTTTTAPTTTSPDSSSATTATTAPASAGAATTVPPSADETTTTTAGSGLSVTGPATGGSDGMANTGGESMIGAGLGLLGLGLVLRRAARPRAR